MRMDIATEKEPRMAKSVILAGDVPQTTAIGQSGSLALTVGNSSPTKTTI